MDRKEFLRTIWKKGIRPLILFVFLFFCFRFIFKALSENGTERTLTLVILFLALFFGIVYFAGLYLSKLMKYIDSKLSDNVRLILRIINRIIEYLTPMVLGVVVYKFWLVNRTVALAFIGFFLIEKIFELVKKEKAVFRAVKR